MFVPKINKRRASNSSANKKGESQSINLKVKLMKKSFQRELDHTIDNIRKKVNLIKSKENKIRNEEESTPRFLNNYVEGKILSNFIFNCRG